MSNEQLEAALLDFLIERNIPSSLSNPDSPPATSARYLISRFIIDLERRRPELLDDLAQISALRVISRTPTLDDAARILGIDASTLWRKRKKYGI